MMSCDVTGMLAGGGWGGVGHGNLTSASMSSPVSLTLHVKGVGHEGDQFKI